MRPELTSIKADPQGHSPAWNRARSSTRNTSPPAARSAQHVRAWEGSSWGPAALDQQAQRGLALCSAAVRHSQALHVETEISLGELDDLVSGVLFIPGFWMATNHLALQY